MAANGYRPAELNAIVIIERVGSVFSLLGCLFIICTFWLSKDFHKPINRIVFYASFGNMMTNVGTLMSRSLVAFPDSFGCQFQAFLIQMFLPADALWTLAMAINVYLTFYCKFDAQRLRRMELPYFLFCYGVPFVPAFAYIFVRDSAGQRMYGDATLWCWVATEWDIMRIATFYAPVWAVILVTFFIYIRAGRTIYEKRRLLQGFGGKDASTPATREAFGSVKTTEVYVTSEIVEPAAILGITNGPSRRSDGSVADPQSMAGAYSVTISSTPRPGPGDPAAADPAAAAAQDGDDAAHPAAAFRRRNFEVNNAAWSYTKCAILFFTAILITWIPSSANRVYSVIHTNSQSMTLEYMSALVLPLQGFWNAIIYMVTSWTAVKDLCAGLRDRSFFQQETSSAVDLTEYSRSDPAGRNVKSYESESMTELANSRGHSNDESEGN